MQGRGMSQVAVDSAPVLADELLRYETSFLLSMLLLRWADSLPAGSDDTEEACYLADSFTSTSVYDLRQAQQSCAALHKQQPHQPPPLVEQQQPQQAPPLLPPTPVLAELLPLLIRLCKGRLQVLLQRQPVQKQPAPHQGPLADCVSVNEVCRRGDVISVIMSPTEGEYVPTVASSLAGNTAGLLWKLVNACFVDPADGSVTGSCSTSAHDTTADEAAAEAARVLACGTPAAPGSFLHSQHTFAAHAQEIISLMESNRRFNTSTAALLASTSNASAHASELVRPPAVAVLLARTAAPGSPVQRQCYSFLCTLLKLGAGQTGSCWPHVLFAVAEGSAALLAGSTLDAGAQQPHQQQQAVRSEQQQPAPPTASAAISLLPSLVIIGRFLLCMAAQLQAGTDGEQPIALQPTQQSFTAYCCGGRLASLVAHAQQWLQAHSQQLAAAGYPPQAVLQQLEQLGSALEAVAAADSQAGSSLPVGQSPTSSSSTAEQEPSTVGPDLLQHLQLTGLALCSLPVPCLCNNPACANTAGLTELSLVSGRSCLCGGCRVARYCCRACQRASWKQHKPVCAALAATAAAAAAAELPAGPPERMEGS